MQPRELIQSLMSALAPGDDGALPSLSNINPEYFPQLFLNNPVPALAVAGTLGAGAGAAIGGLGSRRGRGKRMLSTTALGALLGTGAIGSTMLQQHNRLVNPSTS